MNKFLMPLAVVATIATATGAFAATASGTITEIDRGLMKVTLNDGHEYTFPSGTMTAEKLASFKAGDQVQIEWVQDGTSMDATSIAPLS